MKNILLMFGGNVVEHDISVITALLTFNNINKNLYNVLPIYLQNGNFYLCKKEFTKESIINFNKNDWRKITFIDRGICFNKSIQKIVKIDCALLCTHGGIYEGGGLQGLLEIYNIPYTSSNILTSSLCMDKANSKAFFKYLGLNTTDFVKIDNTFYNNNKEKAINNILEKLTFPIIVKPNNQGSSIGINIAKNENELQINMDIAFAFSNEIIVEKALENFVEYNCAGLKTNLSLSISDIEKPTITSDFLTFNNKYLDSNKPEFPAKISSKLEKEIKNTTEFLFNKLNIEGVARCDFMFDSVEDKLYINEINTIPGSLAFYLFKNQFSFSQMINLLIESSIEKNKTKYIKKYNTNVLNNFNNSCKINFNK